MVVGSLIGLVAAQRVEMTEMPEMVALFNGFGGGASALVSLALFFAMFSAAGSSATSRWSADASARPDHIGELRGLRGPRADHRCDHA